MLRLLGEWYLTRKAYKTAYENLNRARDTERILEILDDPDNITNDFAEFEGSFEMFAATPRELLTQYPIAYLQYIGLLLASGNPAAAAGGAARLNELQSVYEDMDGIPVKRKNRILAEIQSIRIFSVFNDPEKIIACADEALRLLGGGSSVLFKRRMNLPSAPRTFCIPITANPGG